MTNDLLSYKTMPVWQASTVPEGFRRMHNTRDGTWAQLRVLRGWLDFAFLEANGAVVSEHRFTPEQPPPRIDPGQWHRIVALSDDVACQLSFLCTAEDYFAKKHGLTRTHSEVIEAVQRLPVGRALDLGCGSGRNTLYLRLKGYSVDAWDRNPDALATLSRLAAAEGLDGSAMPTAESPGMHPGALTVQQVDLDAVTLTGQYDFILSTVVLMFLQPATIPRLIGQMREATRPGGCNLIVAAMDTLDYPCRVPFPFRFAPGELHDYYADWECLKYNENPGTLHRKDEHGKPIELRFATLLARRPSGGQGQY